MGEEIANLCFLHSHSFDSGGGGGEGGILGSRKLDLSQGLCKEVPNTIYLPVLIAWTTFPGMGGRLELGRKRPVSSSVLTAARGCLVLEGATEVASTTMDAVDEADGGAQVDTGGVARAGSCVSVGLANETCKGSVAMHSSRPAA